MTEPAVVVDLSLARFVKLEERITVSEGEGLRARWEFGHELLAARDGKGKLPRGLTEDLTAELEIHPREIQRRVKFAQRFPDEDALRHAVSQYGSWHVIVHDVLPMRDPAAASSANFTTFEAPDLASYPKGFYRTVVADPPWQYDNRATRAAAEDHYATMPLDALCALPVAARAQEEAHLYLWTTNGFLREAFEVMDAWGFDYKTTLVWAKPQLGIGNYFRSSTEYILFGVRGGLRTIDGNQRNWFEAPRGRHSAKPGYFFDLVEKASVAPGLELFARARRLSAFHWDYWGNEA